MRYRELDSRAPKTRKPAFALVHPVFALIGRAHVGVWFRYLYMHVHTSVNLIQVGPPGYFIHISITTPIVSALKSYYIESFLEVPTGF